MGVAGELAELASVVTAERASTCRVKMIRRHPKVRFTERDSTGKARLSWHLIEAEVGNAGQLRTAPQPARPRKPVPVGFDPEELQRNTQGGAAETEDPVNSCQLLRGWHPGQIAPKIIAQNEMLARYWVGFG